MGEQHDRRAARLAGHDPGKGGAVAEFDDIGADPFDQFADRSVVDHRAVAARLRHLGAPQADHDLAVDDGDTVNVSRVKRNLQLVISIFRSKKPAPRQIQPDIVLSGK